MLVKGVYSNKIGGKDAEWGFPSGAIKSDAGVQGLPCDGVYKQGKPCNPGVISSTAEFVRITFCGNRLNLDYRLTGA